VESATERSTIYVARRSLAFGMRKADGSEFQTSSSASNPINATKEIRQPLRSGAKSVV